MADLRLILTPSQLLCEPQACQMGARQEQMREKEREGKREESKKYLEQGDS